MGDGGSELDFVEIRKRAIVTLGDRWKGYPPSVNDWGPVCRGCGDDEFRIDGFCSCECRDYCNDDDVDALARDVIALIKEVERLRYPSVGGESVG